MFSGSVIGFLHDAFHVFLGDGVRIVVLWKVLAYEAIGVLISGSLPGGMGMRNIDMCMRVASNTFVIGEHLVVISYDRMRWVRETIA